MMKFDEQQIERIENAQDDLRALLDELLISGVTYDKRDPHGKFWTVRVVGFTSTEDFVTEAKGGTLVEAVRSVADKLG